MNKPTAVDLMFDYTKRLLGEAQGEFQDTPAEPGADDTDALLDFYTNRWKVASDAYTCLRAMVLRAPLETERMLMGPSDVRNAQKGQSVASVNLINARYAAIDTHSAWMLDAALRIALQTTAESVAALERYYATQRGGEVVGAD